MSKLHVIGCSLSSPYESFLYDNLNLYKKFHNDALPKIWPELLSIKLNLELNNLSVPASGNDSIFHKFIECIDMLEPKDIVIIGWSNLSRFRWIHNNFWVKKTPFSFPCGDEGMSEETKNEIFINKSHKLREQEIYDYQKIIFKLNSLMDVKTYFWSSDERIINNLPDTERICEKYLCGDMVGGNYNSIFSLIHGESGGDTIEKETDGLVNDHHFGKIGQEYMSNIFYKHIMKYENNE